METRRWRMRQRKRLSRQVEEPEPERDVVTARNQTAQDLKRTVVRTGSHNASPEANRKKDQAHEWEQRIWFENKMAIRRKLVTLIKYKGITCGVSHAYT